MSALPEWIKKLQKEDAEAQLMEEVPSGALAYEALTIAWEALETIDRLGRPGVGLRLRRTNGTVKDAMRHITKLGEE